MKKSTYVTESEVIYAAQRLAAEGAMPTIAMVRAQLGGRGSETTLHKYLQKWKSGLLKRQAINTRDDSSELLNKRIKDLEEANRELNHERNLALKIIRELKLDDDIIEERVRNLNLRKKIKQIKLELENLKSLL